MSQQFDFISRSVDLFRNLSTAMLSGSEELISTQLDSAQAYISRGSQQLMDALSGAAAGQDAESRSEAMQAGMRSAMEMGRDAVLETSELQVETLRLLHQQAAETQRILRDSLAEPSAASEAAAPPEARDRAAGTAALRAAA